MSSRPQSTTRKIRIGSAKSKSAKTVASNSRARNYAIEHAGVMVSKRFRTAAEAFAWAEWNYMGRALYRIVSLAH